VCTECGFDYDDTPAAGAAAAIRDLPRRYRPGLTRGLPGEDLDALVRVRPTDSTWSALEYACHMRDVLAVYDERVEIVTRERLQAVPAMRRDDVAIERNYNAQSTADVLDAIAVNAEALAARLDSLADGDWECAVIREGESLTVDWMARNVVHEGRHHLLDIGRTLRQVRAR
jgi:S-DNA-T family DNA segregation ATPase FtsK/SpoIIIE